MEPPTVVIRLLSSSLLELLIRFISMDMDMDMGMQEV